MTQNITITQLTGSYLGKAIGEELARLKRMGHVASERVAIDPGVQLVVEAGEAPESEAEYDGLRKLGWCYGGERHGELLFHFDDRELVVEEAGR